MDEYRNQFKINPAEECTGEPVNCVEGTQCVEYCQDMESQNKDCKSYCVLPNGAECTDHVECKTELCIGYDKEKEKKGSCGER